MRRGMRLAECRSRVIKQAVAVRPSGEEARASGRPNIKDFQYRAVWRLVASASGDRFRQKAFEFLEIADLRPNVFEVVRGNLAHLTTGGFLRPSQAQQRADLVEGETQLARSSDEGNDARLMRPVHTATARGAWRGGQHLDPLVV